MLVARREKQRRSRYDITHTRLFHVPLAVLAMRDTRSQSSSAGLFLRSGGVIYWRDICRRVVIETTHLRAAKWPLPAVLETGAINFASLLARPAFNLTGPGSLHSLAPRARGNRGPGPGYHTRNLANPKAPKIYSPTGAR